LVQVGARADRLALARIGDVQVRIDGNVRGQLFEDRLGSRKCCGIGTDPDPARIR
jgi:hypothetical protein